MDEYWEGDGMENVNQMRPKRQMKTPFQLETLENAYALDTYPSEATRAELSEKLGLTERQLKMWFCHKRLKDKKEAAGVATTKPHVGVGDLGESPKEDSMVAAPSCDHGSESATRLGSGSSLRPEPTVPFKYYESARKVMKRRVIACIEAQLGEPLREDGPMLGMVFDEAPPFGHTKRNSKSAEAGTGSEVQAHQTRVQEELEKKEPLEQKNEEQMRKEMEMKNHERVKEEQRMILERQRREELFQHEEKREKQKEILCAERRKQKEELRKEKAMCKATARRIAKESIELIEDERLELMELAASSKGLPSIVSLDFDTLQNLECFRGSLCEFPLKSVKRKRPFSIQPWVASDDNVGNLLMAWRFCLNFADILGLWPFTLDEFVQAFHDYDSRLLAEIHIALLKLIIKDIEDVLRAPPSGLGTNQYTADHREGGHPKIVERAYLWGFDICNWQKQLNPLTWPEVLRQFALSAGFGPQLKIKSTDMACLNDSDEGKCNEDIVTSLRSGSAAEAAAALMQGKGFARQRKPKHRLTPGTMKFAAYHVLAVEGDKGMNVLELADKIQKYGLRDLSTCKTPEASVSVALSRDPKLFARIAPSTYRVRPAFRKDPANAEEVLSAAKEEIEKYTKGLLAGQNVEDEERDDGSEGEAAEGPELVDLGAPSEANLNGDQCDVLDACLMNGESKPIDEVAQQNGIDAFGFELRIGSKECLEIDERKAGEPWVAGLTEGEYSDLCVEERLNALVALINIANEGNSIRALLEERYDAANALKKQMWAEAQLDKKQMCADISSVVVDNVQNHIEGTPAEKSLLAQESFAGQFFSPIQQNGNTTEKSRMQLKSFIGHKAEDFYASRSLPLGQDRRRNRYWVFAASGSNEDPGSGRIFVESPNGCWTLIDTEEAFDSLLTSLDTRAIRESHLHIMLQDIEAAFRKCTRKCQPSSSSPSFRIEMGKNDEEIKNASRRYHDFQIWMWKECFGSSISRAMRFGKKRCFPVLGICDGCLDTYLLEDDICPSCNKKMFGKVAMNAEFSETATDFGHSLKIDYGNSMVSNLSHPLRIRLIKALLSSLEIYLPFKALQSSWSEDCRKSWGLQLQNASSAEDLLQILTRFESAVERDYLSSNFETTEELLRYPALSRSIASERSAFPGAVPQLPWIPLTTAAVALRLLELDSSISYDPQRKVEPVRENDVDLLIVEPSSKYASLKDMQKVKPTEADPHGELIEEISGNCLGNSSSGSKSRQVVRGQKRSRSTPESGIRAAEPAPHLFLIKQGGQRHKTGRRTVRRRRAEKKVGEEDVPSYLGSQLIVKSQGSDQQNTYEFGKWESKYNITCKRKNGVREMYDEDGNDDINSDDDNR